jgi:hypothetical protein
MSSMTIERSTVEDAMTEVGYGSYRHYADRVARNLNSAGATVGTVQDFARSQGISIPGEVAEKFIGLVLGDAPTPAGPIEFEFTGDFDKATACEVIRAFIQIGYGSDDSAAEYDEDDVTALLILAGLEDEPEPEPEVVDEVAPEDETPRWAQRLMQQVEGLASFARQHGFRG